jgi:hypothetical protein
MDLKINISSSVAPTIGDLIMDKIRSLNAEISDIRAALNTKEQELNQLQGVVAQFSNQSITIIDDLPKEDRAENELGQTWVERITNVLSQLGRSASTAEIVDFMVSKVPTLDRGKTMNSVAATLSVHSKEGKTFEVSGKNSKNDNLFNIRNEKSSISAA